MSSSSLVSVGCSSSQTLVSNAAEIVLQWLLSEAGISSSSPLVTREAGQQVQKANKSLSVQGKGTEQSWHQTVSTLLAKVSTQLWIPAASFCLGAKLPKLTVPHRSCLCTQATDALGRVWGGTQPHFSPQCPLFAAQAAPLQSPVTRGRHCSQLTLRCISSAEPGRGLKKKLKRRKKKKGSKPILLLPGDNFLQAGNRSAASADGTEPWSWQGWKHFHNTESNK